MGVGAVIAVVGPDNRLHPGTQLAVVAGQVHTDHLTEAAHVIAAAHGHDQVAGGLLVCTCDAGTGAVVGSREGVAVAALGGVLQAVGVRINGSGQIVHGDLDLCVAAHQLTAVLHDSVLGAEVVQVLVGHADGNVLGAGDLIVIHLGSGAVRLGDGAAVPAISGAIGQVEGLAIVRPVRNGVGSAIGCIDGSHLLEAAAMQAVVGGCTGNGVKSAQVVLIMAVQLCGRAGVACGVDLLICPVLIPVQGSVQVGILGAGQGVHDLLDAVLRLISRCCKSRNGHHAECHCGRQDQRNDLFRFHENTPFFFPQPTF